MQLEGSLWVHLAMLQPHDLLDVLNLRVVGNLSSAGIPHIEQFASADQQESHCLVWSSSIWTLQTAMLLMILNLGRCYDLFGYHQVCFVGRTSQQKHNLVSSGRTHETAAG